jgi:hypothetical protein
MSILVLTSDTLIGTPATGNIEYNGQFFGTDSNASRAQMQRITQGTAVASTSGTSIDFTGLPSWIKRITVMFSGVSTTSTSNVQIQIGTGGTPTTSGYLGTVSYIAGTNTTGSNSFTAGFGVINATAAADVYHGQMFLTLLDSATNKWTYSSSVCRSDGTVNYFGAGSIGLAGVLNIVRITTALGTPTFDAGSINILYEG